MEKGFVVWNFDVLYELGNFVHIHGQGHGRRGGVTPHSGLKPIKTLQKIQKIVLQCYKSPLQKV